MAGQASGLVVDTAVAGMSGDMFIAALLGFFSEEERTSLVSRVMDILDQYAEEPIAHKIEDKSYQGIKGLYIMLENEKQQISSGQLLTMVNSISNELGLDLRYQEFARKVVNILLDAEKSVHKSPNTHLHELGTYDTVIDILLPALMLQNLDIKHTNLSIISTGKGSVTTAHGILPVPSPAVDHIIQKYSLEVTDGPNGEALTPTGAAILASLRFCFEGIENYTVRKSSLGFGTKTWENRPNTVRLRLVTPAHAPVLISVLETNLDDTDGELMGYAVEELIDKGALDVSYYPIVMKKNRPAYCLRVLTTQDEEDIMAEEIMKMTGTLGVRIQRINRHVGSRKLDRIKVKVPELGEEIEFQVKRGLHRTKIEFADLRRLSEQYSIPIIRLRHILEQHVKEEA